MSRQQHGAAVPDYLRTIATSEAVIVVDDSSQIGEARRHVNRLETELGFEGPMRGKAAIVVSELATNLVRYARGGEILLRSVVAGDAKWIELFSIDRGPGMKDPNQCLEDGYSTGGTPGTGLGAVKRLSSQFDLISSQPAGTVVYCRLDHCPDVSHSGTPFTWGAVLRPAPHETACGDAWRIAQRPGELAVMVADGLGHGPHAAAASAEAAAAFEHEPFASIPLMLEQAHARMRGTRGGAMAVAQVSAPNGAIQYAGIGNIAAATRTLLGGGGRGLCSNNGTVGVQMRKPQQFDYDGFENGLLVMHSDGLQSRWSLDGYPQLALRHPAAIAGALYRDFNRGRDDVTVVVVRLASI
jgi:anti-sigma regulatory factor (Ser/Thr protein kinase)